MLERENHRLVSVFLHIVASEEPQGILPFHLTSSGLGAVHRFPDCHGFVERTMVIGGEKCRNEVISAGSIPTRRNAFGR